MSKLIFFFTAEDFQGVTFHSMYFLVEYIPVSPFLAICIINTYQKGIRKSVTKLECGLCRLKLMEFCSRHESCFPAVHICCIQEEKENMWRTDACIADSSWFVLMIAEAANLTSSISHCHQQGKEHIAELN